MGDPERRGTQPGLERRATQASIGMGGLERRGTMASLQRRGTMASLERRATQASIQVGGLERRVTRRDLFMRESPSLDEEMFEAAVPKKGFSRRFSDRPPVVPHEDGSDDGFIRHERTQSMPTFENEDLLDGQEPFADDVIFVDMLDSAHMMHNNDQQMKHESPLLSQASSMFNISFESAAFRNPDSFEFEPTTTGDPKNYMGGLKSKGFFSIFRKFSRPPVLKTQEYEWKKPPDEDSILPEGALLYLGLIGWLTFFVCHSVSMAAQALDGLIQTLSFELLLVCRSLAAVFAYLIPSFFSLYAFGSGVPELKCILNGAFLQNSLSFTTIAARIVGLILALSSGLSVGRLGPFMHIAGGIASMVSGTGLFSALSTARYQLQAISVASAAGIGATLGAPLGGTLMSIELMSSYYLIHWLPMALYCSLMGYILCVSVLSMDERPFFYASNVRPLLHNGALIRIFSYILIGVVCGLVGPLLVRVTSRSMIYRSKIAPSKNRSMCVALLLTFSTLHNLISWGLGGVMWMGQRQGVSVLFNSEIQNLPVAKFLEGLSFISPTGKSLLTMGTYLVTKFMLTALSLSMPIPAGTFGPIFELGALLGVFCGALLKLIPGLGQIDTRVQAIAGAAALPTSVLHTISVAVVMMELVGDSEGNLLPIALACLSSYFVSKNLTADLFSTIIKRRQLPFVIGLRESHEIERDRWRNHIAGISAQEIMIKNFPFLLRHSKTKDVRELLQRGGWTVCALLSDLEHKHLLGAVSRSCVEDAFRAASRRQIAEDAEFSFLQNCDSPAGHPFVDPAPFQVPKSTPYWKIATYFQMLGTAYAYVMDQGKCVGLITKGTLISYNRMHTPKKFRTPVIDANDEKPAVDTILGDIPSDGDAKSSLKRNSPGLPKSPSLAQASGVAGLQRKISVRLQRRGSRTTERTPLLAI